MSDDLDEQIKMLGRYTSKSSENTIQQIEESVINSICEVFLVDDIDDLSDEQREKVIEFANSEHTGVMETGFNNIIFQWEDDEL